MENRFRTLVVGVASAAEPDPVLPVAVELAERLGATLQVVTVFQLPERIVTAYAAYAQYVEPELNQRYASQVREQLWEQVLPYSRRVTVSCHALQGSASERLCAFATHAGADLLIVGVTRRGRLLRQLLGTTAERVLRGSPVPVLVVGQPMPTLERVLLTTDLSPLSGALQAPALAAVEGLAGGEPLQLRALLVVHYDAGLPPPLRPELLQQVAETELTAFLAEHATPERGIELRVRTGDPPREIIAEAAEWPADLLVLGTSGHFGPGPLALGSTAAATLRSAPCNVLVIPAARAAAPPDRAPVGEADPDAG